MGLKPKNYAVGLTLDRATDCAVGTCGSVFVSSRLDADRTNSKSWGFDNGSCPREKVDWLTERFDSAADSEDCPNTPAGNAAVNNAAVDNAAIGSNA